MIYIYIPPKKTNDINIPADTGHFIRSEIDSTDLKKSNLAAKIKAKKIVDKYRKAARKRQYTVPNVVLEAPSNTEDIDRIDTIEMLEDIAALQPGKNAQLAATKICETLETNAEDLFQADNITKKEEEDAVLEQIKNEYGFEDIKETMDEGNVPENIYFFFGGKTSTEP